MRRRSALPLAAVAALLFAPAASACPTCDAGIRQRVRAAVFGPDFARNLSVGAAPFAAFGFAAAALHGRPGGRP